MGLHLKFTSFKKPIEDIQFSIFGKNSLYSKRLETNVKKDKSIKKD